MKIDKTLYFLIILLLLTGQYTKAQSGEAFQYKGKVKIVLGDVKQRFINNQIHTEEQVNNLVKGLSEFKVSGVRVPIFPENTAPNGEMLDLFILKAQEAGYTIYANPVLWSGATRIANQFFDKKNIGPSALGDSVKTQILIDRIKQFAANYKCDWICPFNEDGKPGKDWSIKQMNKIYAALHGQLNGAELTGPDTWGIPAGIEIFEETEIPNYITVASTHNLGFNHNAWKEFIELAHDKGLPAWDSEVNNNEKNGKVSRLVAAVEAGVDGLVLYNSGNMINLQTGEINEAGKAMLDIYYNQTVSSQEEKKK
ncbi:MAG: hypothetical protein AAFO07_07960 [Bacteroidota bacterium]